MKILHVPYTYLPDPLGGTEVYVRALTIELMRSGITSCVAAPGHANADFKTDDGVSVYRFAAGSGPLSSEGVPDVLAAESFARLLEELRPDVVHLHARTATVSELLFDAARRVGASTVFTYHTPTVSCLRGTMLLRGSRPCDGVLDSVRCAACTLQCHGLGIMGLDRMLAHAPVSLGRTLTEAGMLRGVARVVRMRQITSDFHARLRTMLAKADKVVAVCDWVADVLRRNGIAEPKLCVSRQGVLQEPNRSPAALRKSMGDADGLRIGYFGRLDPGKGVDVLVQAMRRVPDARIALEIYGVLQSGSDPYAMRLKRLADMDVRIRFLAPVPSHEIGDAMQRMDLVAVPSLLLETGPLVVLEAFAAGVPVLGSRLGGIAELIDDDVTGRLLAPGDVECWARWLADLSSAPEVIARWRAGIQWPRTMADASADMIEVYREALRARQSAA